MQSVFYGQHRSLVGSRIYGVEQVLIARTIGVLERHADASFARLALSDRNGTYAGVSENDPAIVSLRTWHRKLDLHGVDTQLTGEFAYPMVSRGRLVGLLLVGPKRSQESYAPDESDAIEDLAHHVGGVLDVLGHSTSSDGSVLAELKALHQAITDGFSSLRQKLRDVALNVPQLRLHSIEARLHPIHGRLHTGNLSSQPRDVALNVLEPRFDAAKPRFDAAKPRINCREAAFSEALQINDGFEDLGI